MTPSRLRTPRHALAAAAVLALSTLPVQRSQAAACTFTPLSGNWSLSTNWSCGVVPSAPPADSAAIAAGRTVVVDSTQSIRQLGNAGTININAFLLDLQSGAGTTNTGVINVGGASTAALQIGAGHHIDNTGGLINIANGSVANQFGSTITGGTITTTGSGKVAVFNNSNNVLRGVTLNGTLDMASALAFERVQSGLVLNGTINVNADSVLSFEGSNTLSGNGSIAFGSSGNNRLGVDNNGVLTIGATTTLRGVNANIGDALLFGGNGQVVNQGLISSDSGGTFTLRNLNNGLVNQNIVEAKGAGSVVQLQSAVDNTGGTLRSSNGGVIVQQGVSVTGGTISNTTGGSYALANNGNNFLRGVTVAGGSTVDMASGLSTARVTNGLTNNGTIVINADSILSFEGTNTLSGNGSIVFGSSGNNRVGVDNNGVLTIGANATIRGQNGNIGDAVFVGGNGKLINDGTISADVAGGVITLHNLNQGITNNGTISALNGGTIQLQSHLTGAPGSQLVAGAGSTIQQQGVTVSGVVNTSGSGSFRPTNNGNNFLSGVTLNGTLDMASALSNERVIGNLALNGTVNLNADSILSFQGNNTLSGNATIVFGSSGNNRVGVDNNGVLTIGANATIRGQNGNIGDAIFVGGNGKLINDGTISADVAGGVITLRNLNQGITNNGTISALNGGTIQLQSHLTGAPGSQLVAGAGSTIQQQGVTVSGVVNTSGSGSFRPTNNGNNFLSGVTLNGTLDMASALSNERVIGNLVLNGTVNLNADSILSFQGANTLAGAGTIVFGNSGNNRLGVDNNGVLTIGATTTLRGVNANIGDAIFVGGNGQLINQGLISSDSGGTFTVRNLNAGLVNQNLVEAKGAGSVVQLQSHVDNTGGTLRSSGGGVIVQQGVSVTGGTISNTTGGSYALANNGNNFLRGVTVAGGSTVDMASGLSTARVTNGLTNNGTLNLNTGSILSFEGVNTLSGNGSIVFGSGANNRVGVDNNGVLTIGANASIRGQNGSIGDGVFVGGNNALVNNGTINSDGGGTINLRALNAGLTSNGLLRAQNGTLNVQNVVGGTGTLQVDATGVITLANGGNSQGTLAMGAAGAALNLGTGNLVIGSDYTNAAAGTGNAFDRRAGVSGSGQIVAGGNAAQAITGAGVTGGNTANATLTLGNVRVGTTTYNVQIANTGSTGPTLRGALQTAVNGGNISDARLSGSGVTAANYIAGGPGGNSGNLAINFTAASAGALAPLNGQAVNLRSNFENIGDQKLNIVLAGNAAAYNAAVGHVASPVVLANQRVGGGNTAVLSIGNTAAAGSFSEDLHASVGSVGGAAQASGSVTGRLAGSTSSGSGAITVGVDTSQSGLRSGVVNVDFQTAGAVNGVSNGLGLAGAGSQAVSVQGAVYQAAAGQLQGNVLNFGTLQVGQQISQNLVVRNVASGAAGYVEDLNASFGAAGNAQITGSGSLAGIVAGSNSTAANGTMKVTVTGAAAGVLNSGIGVNYFSAGQVNGSSNGLGTLAVGSETFGVNGTITATANIVNQAAPQLLTPVVDLGAVRVGAASPTALVAVRNQATAGPQAALNASITSNGAPVLAVGSVNLLAPGAAGSGMQVGLNTTVAGNYTGANAGSATVNLVSDASNIGGCTPNCQVQLASQNVTVLGKVYTTAIGQSNTPVLDFGIVRVGETPSARNITVSNGAALTALNDTLGARVNGLSGPFSAGNPAAGIAAGGTGQVSVSLNTASAGVYSSSGQVAFSSHNADLQDVSAGDDVGVLVRAQVNNVANAGFSLLSSGGHLSLQADGSYLLDLGTLSLHSAGHWSLDIANLATGPADALRGSFDLGAVDDFALGGFGSVDPLDAGEHHAGLEIDFSAAQVGQFEDRVAFQGFSVNGFSRDLDVTRQLRVRAVVVDPNGGGGGGGGTVPEPGTLLLVLAAAGAARRLGARRQG